MINDPMNKRERERERKNIEGEKTQRERKGGRGGRLIKFCTSDFRRHKCLGFRTIADRICVNIFRLV